jgi:hypothetical protein
MRKNWFSASSCETLLFGSSRSPKASAPAMQALTQAGVASGSTPGVRPCLEPASMRSTQKVHLVATAMRAGSKRASSCSARRSP